MNKIQALVVDDWIKLGISNGLGIPSNAHRFIETRKKLYKKKKVLINWRKKTRKEKRN